VFSFGGLKRCDSKPKAGSPHTRGWRR